MDHQYAPEGSKLEHKLQLYTAAVMLFDHGRSHPQIVKFLSEHETDSELVSLITDKAMRNEWDELHDYGRQLISEGKPYDEIIRLMSEKEDDKEVINFLCNKWYEWRSEWVEYVQEAPYNIQQGIIWIVLCGSMVAITFIFQWWLFSKLIWIVGLAASVLQFLLGLFQRRLSKNIEKLLHTRLESS
jgi:hypothetical protein